MRIVPFGVDKQRGKEILPTSLLVGISDSVNAPKHGSRPQCGQVRLSVFIMTYEVYQCVRVGGVTIKVIPSVLLN
jgi:hypothetical protein